MPINPSTPPEPSAVEQKTLRTMFTLICQQSFPHYGLADIRPAADRLLEAATTILSSSVPSGGSPDLREWVLKQGNRLHTPTCAVWRCRTHPGIVHVRPCAENPDGDGCACDCDLDTALSSSVSPKEHEHDDTRVEGHTS